MEDFWDELFNKTRAKELEELGDDDLVLDDDVDDVLEDDYSDK